MADSNPLFDDFLELDFLDPAGSGNDLFSFLANTDDLNIPTESNNEPSLSLPSVDPINSLGSLEPIAASEDKTLTHAKQNEQQDIQLLLAHNMQQHQQQGQEESYTTATAVSTHSNVIDNSSLVAQLITPSPLSIALPSATCSAVPEMTVAPEIITSTISATDSATAQIAALIDSSKNIDNAPKIASAGTKRSSPELTLSARKQVKMDTASTEKASSLIPSLTSPANTTLSAATLQFLLQQQSQTPLVPQLFTGKLTRVQIEETLTRLLETTKHLLQISKEAAKEEQMESEAESEDVDGVENKEEHAGHTSGLKTQPGIKTDDIPSSTDMKKMTSKERRQLRNKISARNFRIRRKEYIGTLEEQVEQHKTEAQHLREAVVMVYEENKRLKEELESVKRQLTLATIANASSTVAPQQQLTVSSAIASTTSLTTENQSLLASILGRSAFNPNAKNVTLSMPRSQSPNLTPNLHKDVPNSASAKSSSWKDKNPVFVHTALVPDIRLGELFQFGDKAAWSKEDEMWDRPWLDMKRTPKELLEPEKNPLFVSSVIYELLSTLASTMTLDMMVMPKSEKRASSVQEEVRATVQDYENDRRAGEELEWTMQHDLCAQAQVDERRMVDVDVDENYDNITDVLYKLNGSPISPASCSSLMSLLAGCNGLDWLYELMVPQLLALDMQSAYGQRIYLPFAPVQYS
ncbi:hypothetical protein BGZ51_006899 [Haplosporangium sp. Z 767]|nr:hypothetical protein BGZ51_006899 [Haplosporangium sp. Z 767]KAF9179496.1 hypothetical protein BGZ50_006887 [Haplosporangium sp. Z 11]